MYINNVRIREGEDGRTISELAVRPQAIRRVVKVYLSGERLRAFKLLKTVIASLQLNINFISTNACYSP